MQAAATRRTDGLDELTLRRAQRGDERAWRDLIAHYQRPVHALVWRLLDHQRRARHRAEDLAQETFVRVLRGLPTFDPAGPATLSTWILTIATRVVLNELRRPEPGSLELEREPTDPSPERADHQSERARLGAAIASGIGRLPEGQRAVIVLREYHGLDYAEIADALELDVGTVKSRLSRARDALREHLGAMGLRDGSTR